MCSFLIQKDIEQNIPKNDKRLDVWLMGCSYDILRKNKGIKPDQLCCLVQNEIQKKDPHEDFGLYRYAQDPQAKSFRVKKADWSQALSQYSQNKLSDWEKEAAQGNSDLQEHLLNKISKDLVLGYHFSGTHVVDGDLKRMLSDECSNAACKNFDEKEKEISKGSNTVSIDAVKRRLLNSKE